MNILQRAEGISFIVAMVQNCSEALTDSGRFASSLMARRASGEGLMVTESACNLRLTRLAEKYREQADRLQRFAREIETLKG